MPLFGNPPWHLWGNSQVLEFVSTGGVNSAFLTQSNQVVKVSYKRPDTWTFFLGARLVDGPNASPEVVNISVDFDLMIGTGRSVFSTKPLGASGPGSSSFHEFRWAIPAGNPFPRGSSPLYTTTVRPPQAALIAGVPPLVISEFPAQDIQCEVSANVSSILPLAAGVWKIEIFAFFAPKVHVRPDWFSNKLRALNEILFRGDESGGT